MDSTNIVKTLATIALYSIVNLEQISEKARSENVLIDRCCAFQLLQLYTGYFDDIQAYRFTNMKLQEARTLINVTAPRQFQFFYS